MSFSDDIHRLRSRYEPYYGKYRAKVINNEDPLLLGRIQANVAAVPGSGSNWCMPCTPYGGDGVGFYAIPPIGANVWIEFEGGNVNFPIWAGCFWAEGETPTVDGEPPNPLIKTLKTASMTFTLDDTPDVGGASLACSPAAVATPLKMTFNSLGVKIDASPAILEMLTKTGVTLTFPPGVISITETGVEVSVTDSIVSITEAEISLAAATIEATTEGALTFDGGADVSMTAGGAVEITGAGDVAVTGAMVLIN